MFLSLTGCASTTSEIDEGTSLRPLSDEDGPVVFDDFYPAIVGTMDATYSPPPQ
ncbi:hypothetical protein [Arthrobacter sp. L77]|uniref:hypothetical protein n=1 Tax=Arthrobacter sp. L77 TaxID=1496689 RepID=UPI000AB2A490|nr:hypothetical protein [Arthrobacter sp. L77]